MRPGRLEVFTIIGCALIFLGVLGMAVYAAGYSAGAKAADEVCYCGRR